MTQQICFIYAYINETIEMREGGTTTYVIY